MVSIIIPCRNEAAGIRGCLASARAQAGSGQDCEIIIADGMSEDGTREIVREMQREEPRVRLIDNPGRIVSTGLNAGIRAARGEIIIRMDAHTEYAPDYVQQCVATLEKTGAENVGGPARTLAGTYLERAIAAAYHSAFATGGARFHDPEYEGWVDTITYGCWRRETFERFGLFDDELVRNQDDEHNLRIIRGGGRIWQSPAIKSWYRPRGSLRLLFEQYRQYGYWKVRLIQKHKLPASWRHVVPGTFVLTLGLLGLAATAGHLASAIRAESPPVLALFPAAFCSGLAAYLGVVGVASLHAAWRTGWRLLPVLPAVFACYHFGYGLGFLAGIWDFAIRKTVPRRRWRALTR